MIIINDKFIENIKTVKLKHQFNNEYILDIKVNYDFSLELFRNENLLKIENELFQNQYEKGQLYYFKYKYDLYKYGYIDSIQWWSSSTLVINKEFNINIHECLINNLVCGIDIEFEKYIIEKFKLKRGKKYGRYIC